MGIDLFAGVGGLTLGFEQAGVDVVAALERDPIHADAHRYNFPLTEVLVEDAAKATGERLRHAAERGYRALGRQDQWDGTIDVVFGGPPCQGFSTGGTRQPDDERNLLVFQFLRLVRELAPRYFVMENVPGLLMKGHADIRERLLRGFREAGYEIGNSPVVVNAADFGAPQDRRRVIVVGWRRGERAVPLPPPAVCRAGTTAALAERDGRGSLRVGPTVADAIGDLPDVELFPELLASDSVELPHDWSAEPSEYVRRLNGDDPADLSYPRRWDRSLLTCSGRTSHSEEAVARFAKTKPGKTDRISRFRRLEPDGLCKTLRAGTGPDHGSHTPPRPIHPTVARVITVREGARLHGFPDWFRFHVTKWHAWRQLGNSVPPLLARAIAVQIVAALGNAPTRPARELVLGSAALLGYVELDGKAPTAPKSARSRAQVAADRATARREEVPLRRARQSDSDAGRHRRTVTRAPTGRSAAASPSHRRKKN